MFFLATPTGKGARSARQGRRPGFVRVLGDMELCFPNGRARSPTTPGLVSGRPAFPNCSSAPTWRSERTLAPDGGDAARVASARSATSPPGPLRHRDLRAIGPRPPQTAATRSPHEHGRDTARETPDRPTSRCSTRRSAPTWPAPSPPTATARRSSPDTRASAGRYAEFGERVGQLRQGPDRRSGSSAATGSGCGARTTPSGRCCSTPRPRSASILVNINPAYRTHELAYALNQSGCRIAVRRPVVQDVRLRGHGRAGRARTCPASSGRCSSGRTSGTSWSPAAAGRSRRRRLAARRAGPAAGRPDQHPVHVGHDRVPEGRHADAPQHPQQRLLRRPSCRASRPTTGCASRCPSTTASGW